MVAFYLLFAVLRVYETGFMNSLYNSSSQFAFLRTIFWYPSPAATDLLDWQNVLLFQAVPFLLFFYFAVRMRLSPMGKILPTMITTAAVGACLSILNSILAAYQTNIAHLLLPGSFTGYDIVTPALSAVLSSTLSSVGLLFVLEGSAVFVALGMTGIAFGFFAGDTPYWIFRSWLESGRDNEEEPTPEDSAEEASSSPVGE